MSGYNPDKLNEQADNAEEPSDTAEITDIQETTAGEVYGDDVDFDYDPARKMIRVTAETSEGVEVEDTFGLPQDEMSWYNPNFKLGQFKDYYGEVPSEGMEVTVSVNSDGILSIDY